MTCNNRQQHSQALSTPRATIERGDNRSFNKLAKITFQNGRENAPNGRYHAPDFSLKNAKLRLNIIIIDILRAACVFIAFTFPQPCECVVFQNSVAKESFLPSKSSAGVLLESWRSKGAMNFRKPTQIDQPMSSLCFRMLFTRYIRTQKLYIDDYYFCVV